MYKKQTTLAKGPRDAWFQSKSWKLLHLRTRNCARQGLW